MKYLVSDFSQVNQAVAPWPPPPGQRPQSPGSQARAACLFERGRRPNSPDDVSPNSPLVCKRKGPAQHCAREEGARAALCARGRGQGSSWHERNGPEPLCVGDEEARAALCAR